MSTTSPIAALAASAAAVVRARVHAWCEDGTILVDMQGDRGIVPCDLLVVADGHVPVLASGDVVLVADMSDGAARSIVLGRVGPSRLAPLESPLEADTAAPHATEEAPDELVIEARKSLTLRVGGGSITLREDGKILIKGNDLVSHAQRMNRIKGGAVSIN